jgi:predicted ATPase
MTFRTRAWLSFAPPTQNSAIEHLASEVVGIRTRNALSAFLRARCRLSTVAMFIEDVHWIDTASEDWMTRIGDNDRNLPLLIACAYRPHYRTPSRVALHERTHRASCCAPKSHRRTWLCWI